jgi:hypothetical protein
MASGQDEVAWDVIRCCLDTETPTDVKLKIASCSAVPPHMRRFWSDFFRVASKCKTLSVMCTVDLPGHARQATQVLFNGRLEAQTFRSLKFHDIWLDKDWLRVWPDLSRLELENCSLDLADFPECCKVPELLFLDVTIRNQKKTLFVRRIDWHGPRAAAVAVVVLQLQDLQLQEKLTYYPDDRRELVKLIQNCFIY